MGGGSSRGGGTVQPALIQSALDKKKEKKRKDFTILLLGAGECGKSTILKQMTILHMGGFKDTQRKQQLPLVRKNVITAMKTVLGVLPDQTAGDLAELRTLEKLEDSDETLYLDGFKKLLKELWQRETLKLATNVPNFPDSGLYFLEKIDAIFSKNYLPCDEDLLRARQRTTGIVETQFCTEENGTNIRMIDVGGQRGERTNWMKVLTDIDCLMFIASLSEYNQSLEEAAHNTNRLKESLHLFKSLTNTPQFQECSVILFLNKNDLFQEKIKKYDLAEVFPDYKGGFDYEAGLNYILAKYKRRGPKSDHFYIHVTTATDTKSVQYVFDAVLHTLLANKLNESGVIM